MPALIEGPERGPVRFPERKLSAACARGRLIGRRGLGQGRRLMNDAATEHARLPFRRIVEHAGLSRRNTVLSGDQVDLDALCGAAQPGWPRRARRAHPYEHLVPAGTKGLLDRALPDPIHVAQPHAARAQRLARTDDDAPGRGLEPHHIERMASRDAEPAALPNREPNDAVVTAEHLAVEINNVARLG